MAFNREAAKKAGYSDQEIDAYLAQKKVPEQSTSLPASLMRMLGGGGMADIAGIAFEPGRQVRKAIGGTVEQNPYFTQSQAEGWSKNPVKEVGRSALKDILSAAILGTGVGGVSTLGTKAGTAYLTQKAVSAGKEIPWEKVRSRAQETVGKLGEIGQDVELRDTLNNLLAKIVPSKNLGQTAMSATEILNTRRQLLERYGTSILDWLKGGPSLEQKVAGAVRGGLSELLHEAAPGTRLPDYLYSLYSKGGKFGGDIPTLAVKYGLGIPLLQQLLGPIGKALGRNL